MICGLQVPGPKCAVRQVTIYRLPTKRSTTSDDDEERFAEQLLSNTDRLPGLARGVDAGIAADRVEIVVVPVDTTVVLSCLHADDKCLVARDLDGKIHQLTLLDVLSHLGVG